MNFRPRFFAIYFCFIILCFFQTVSAANEFRSVILNGTSTHLRRTAIAPFSGGGPSQNWYYSAWVNMEALPGTGQAPIFAISTTSLSEQVLNLTYLGTNYGANSNKFVFAVSRNGTEWVSGIVGSSVASPANIGQWYFVEAMYNGSSIGISVNGSAFTTVAYNQGIASATTATPYIGMTGTSFARSAISTVIHP